MTSTISEGDDVVVDAPRLPSPLVGPPRPGLQQGLVGITRSSPRLLPNLRSQPLRKPGRPGAAGVRDDRLLEFGQVPERIEAALDGRDELLGLDAIGRTKQALQIGPIVLDAAELLERRRCTNHVLTHAALAAQARPHDARRSVVGPRACVARERAVGVYPFTGRSPDLPRGVGIDSLIRS